jgi:hypothetical protein
MEENEFCISVYACQMLCVKHSYVSTYACSPPLHPPKLQTHIVSHTGQFQCTPAIADANNGIHITLVCKRALTKTVEIIGYLIRVFDGVESV